MVTLYDNKFSKEVEDKLKFLQKDRFILYPRAAQILDKMEELLQHEKVNRPPSFLIVGEPNNGKTMIARYFIKKHESYEDEEGLKVPALMTQAPHKPDINLFYDKILDSLGIPYKKSEPLSLKEDRIFDAYKRFEIKLLIIDEIHNILSGTALKQREFMNAIKNLINETMRPIVLIGTKDALIATNTDYQISSRFKPEILERWTFNEDYLNFIKTLEISLRSSEKPDIYKNINLAKKILSLSEGLLGEIVALVKELVRESILKNKKVIDESLLSSIKWIEPSQRRNLAALNI